MAARTSASSWSSSAVASSAVRARAVMRTLIPSMPEARKASVTVPAAPSSVVDGDPARGLGQPRLAGAPGAQDAADDDAALLARLGHAGAQVGQDAPLEHLGHLVGHAGDGVDHLVAERADEAGAVPITWGMMAAPTGTSAWRAVVGRHGAAREPKNAGDDVDDRLVAHQRDPHDLGDGLAGDVVLGRPEAAADDDRRRCGPAPCGRPG